MPAHGSWISEVQVSDIMSWDRSDEWLAMVADLHGETTQECEGEPAVGM